MKHKRTLDILHVAAGSTRGWRVNDEVLRIALEELGVTVARIALRRPSGGLVGRLGSPANDLWQAASLAIATQRALDTIRPRALIYSTSHAALLQPSRSIPEAVWVDGPIALMRPGVRNVPIRSLERLRQHRLDIAMAMSLQNPDALVDALRPRRRIPLHVPIDPSPQETSLPAHLAPPFGVTYGGAPGKKGLDLALEAWKLVAPDMPLIVTGISRESATRYLGGPIDPNVRFMGVVPRGTHRAIVRHATVYVSASRREEYGTSQLEALADRVPIAMVPSLGAAEPVAALRRVAPDLVALDISSTSLARCISTAIKMTGEDLASYRARATEVMRPYSYVAFKQQLESRVLPALIGSAPPIS